MATEEDDTIDYGERFHEAIRRLGRRITDGVRWVDMRQFSLAGRT